MSTEDKVEWFLVCRSVYLRVVRIRKGLQKCILVFSMFGDVVFKVQKVAFFNRAAAFCSLRTCSSIYDSRSVRGLYCRASTMLWKLSCFVCSTLLEVEFGCASLLAKVSSCKTEWFDSQGSFWRLLIDNEWGSHCGQQGFRFIRYHRVFEQVDCF